MSPADYEFLRKLLLESSGLALGNDKAYLIESRLIPIAQSFAMNGIAELVQAIRTGAEPRLPAAIIEAMTTNETSFFRDRTPFDELKSQLLPELIRARRAIRRLRIWSAAASTGQEAYSIALMLVDAFPELDSWSIEIVATDLAAAMLERGRSGVYTTFEVQRGLPVHMLVKHFKQVESHWRISDDIRRRVHWRKMNLLDDFRCLGVFDVIFCRNVLIYFSPERKSDVLNRLARQMMPDGYLILGAAESALGLTSAIDRMSPCKAAIYRLATPVMV